MFDINKIEDSLELKQEHKNAIDMTELLHLQYKGEI